MRLACRLNCRHGDGDEFRPFGVVFYDPQTLAQLLDGGVAVLQRVLDDRRPGRFVVLRLDFPDAPAGHRRYGPEGLRRAVVVVKVQRVTRRHRHQLPQHPFRADVTRLPQFLL